MIYNRINMLTMKSAVECWPRFRKTNGIQM